MNAKELRDILSGYPDDTLVVMSSDSEGNSFSPVVGFTKEVMIYRFDPSKAWMQGSIESTDDRHTKEEFESGSCRKCVVIWPLN